MTRSGALALFPFIAALPASPVTTVEGYESAVVGISVTYQSFDQDRPWRKKIPQTRDAQVVVVPGPFLLTTAQMIADATLIEVEKRGRGLSVPVRPVLVDEQVNLALLSVEDPEFFSDLEPVRLSPVVPTEGVVRSVRWKSQQMEVSTSRISRIEVQTALLGEIEHPFLQLTSDLAGGGWSEPVFGDDGFIGLTVSQNEQAARAIPVDLVAEFLRKARQPSSYRGFASFALGWQVNEDPALASYLGLSGEPRGVVITAVPWGSSACGVLRPRDVLLKLDGREIDASGYYQHPQYGRLRFSYIPIEGHSPGDMLPAELWRDGRLEKVRIRLRRADSETSLIPDRRPGLPPAYLVAGGLVFRELDGAYLRTWGDAWTKDAPLGLVTDAALFSEAQLPERRRIIVISSVLPAAYNIGYHDVADLEVRQINGRDVDTIAEVEEALHLPEGAFHRIVLRPNTVRAEIVLDAATLASATAEILEAYGIPEPVRLGAPLPDLGPPCTGP